ncbi:Integrase core domain protein [Palleronia marisminoris]|uniref:Integrase core domain protein n=3 Tax=Palleronia marisminoris TaxID=315423 RepID=A0A1Y5TZK8_9RHOB|nr:Integrase core domain protein [Palleronia marisminoris]
MDDFREGFGVEPICRELPIAPSTYYERKAIARDPSRASKRARRDNALREKIRRVRSDNRGLYGARKVWHVLRREGVAQADGAPMTTVARCTAERLMREMGLQGVVRGKKVVTTNPDAARPCPDDKVNRAFHADRRIVGWRVSTSMTGQFVPDALEQAPWQRKPMGNKSLIHHWDRGSQYPSIKHSERLADAEVDPSVGTVGDSYDNALAESVIGLFKTEVIKQFGPWKTMQAVEWETFHRVDRYNEHRLLSSLGYMPPAEAERRHLEQPQPRDKVA